MMHWKTMLPLPQGVLAVLAVFLIPHHVAHGNEPTQPPQLRFETCPAVDLDVQSKPWQSKPLLARLSVSPAGTLQNIGLAQSSGISGVDESYFAWLSACQYRSAPTAQGPLDLLVGIHVRDPDSTATSSATTPRRADCNNLTYPARAARDGAQGKSTLQYFVANDGAFVAVAVVGSSGHAALDYAALLQLLNCRLPRPESLELGSNHGRTFRMEFIWKLY